MIILVAARSRDSPRAFAGLTSAVLRQEINSDAGKTHSAARAPSFPERELPRNKTDAPKQRAEDRDPTHEHGTFVTISVRQRIIGDRNAKACHGYNLCPSLQGLCPSAGGDEPRSCRNEQKNALCGIVQAVRHHSWPKTLAPMRQRSKHHAEHEDQDHPADAFISVSSTKHQG